MSISTWPAWIERSTERWLRLFDKTSLTLASAQQEAKVTPETQHESITSKDDADWQTARTDSSEQVNASDGTLLNEIPDYVIKYAPLVHLYSGEEFWPCDMAEHLNHVTPNLNYTAIRSQSHHQTLQNLDDLNKWEHGRFVFLKSNDDVEERPDWLGGAKNIPTSNITSTSSKNQKEWIHYPGRDYVQGLKDAAEALQNSVSAELRSFGDEESSAGNSNYEQDAAKLQLGDLNDQIRDEMRRLINHPKKVNNQVRGGRSDAPAVLIVVDKGHGIVDAFWFFFYSFNLGNKVFNIRFGNHVGDWEHSAVRFHHGKPRAVFFSEHNFGSAYSYAAVEKFGKRPVIYSATGTHAMYATAGTHPYVLPWGILHDQTDRGPLWDPVLNFHTYTYDFQKDVLRASNLTPDAPIGWFHFAGHWGDKFYPLQDRRQYQLVGQYHYVNGPLGPKFKNLGRKKICGGPDSAPCVIKHWLGGSTRMPRWQGQGEEADAWSAYAKYG